MKNNQVKEMINKLYSDYDYKKNVDVSNITFYNTFDFENVGLSEKNIFVVKFEKEIKNEKITLYEIYNIEGELIATVDSTGKIHFAPEYIELLKNIDKDYLELLNYEDVDFVLPEELQKEDILIEKEELEDKKTKETIEKLKEITDEEEINSYSEADANQQVFEKLTNKQELDANVRVSQNETLADMVPAIKENGYEKIGIVYSDKIKGESGRFSFVGITKDGKIELIEGLENIDGTQTGQTVTSINSYDGSLVEQKQVAGMVRINGRSIINGEEEFLSVTVGQYGILEVDYVRANLSKDKDERYFSTPIETKNLKPTTREVRDMADKTINPDISKEKQRADAEIQRDGETQIENIDDRASNDIIGIDDVLVLEDGTKTSIRRQAQKAKVSPEEFLGKYETYSGKTPDEILNKVHDEIEEEYRGNSKLI